MKEIARPTEHRRSTGSYPCGLCSAQPVPPSPYCRLSRRLSLTILRVKDFLPPPSYPGGFGEEFAVYRQHPARAPPLRLCDFA